LMPKRTSGQRAGFRAEAFVDKVVSDAGFIWNPRSRDFGIDGQIESVDRAGEVSGYAVLAQVKGTEARFPGEDDRGLRFTCEARHIDYWLRCAQPVVLICVNLVRQEAWWKRLDVWFADPIRRARRVVEFDKSADRFDSETVGTVTALCTPVAQPLPRLAVPERLTTNLLAVASFAPLIHSAPTPCRERGDAWERMRSNGAFESGFALSKGRIYSMASLDGGPLTVLCDGPVESQLTGEWSMTEDPDQKKLFVALLNFTLRAAHHRELVWHSAKQVVYYQAPHDLSKKKVKGRAKGSGRGFFAPYYGKDDETKVSYCRHYAAGLYFRRWDGRWFLEINPTYHFTIDGHRDSYYDAEYVKKIKQFERNNAVFALVRAWADLLRGEDTLFGQRDERILFGELATVQADAAIDEKVWIIPKKPGPSEDGGLFEGLWDLQT
jgi:Domain of unknown function (DUF4365)